MLACFGLLTVFAVFAAAREPQPPASAAAPRVSAERLGALATRDGLQLTLTADTGSVHVFTDAPASATNRAGATRELRYAVHIEAAAGDEAATLLKEFSLAARGTPRGVVLAGRMPKSRDAERVWVIYEVHVPRQYSLEISTRAGDITIQDVDGTVTLSTGGGNIEAGRIGSSAVITGVHEAGKLENAQRFVGRLDTAGGHITVGNVSGGLRATTGGGHISAGNIDGDAVLHTAGGDLHAGRLAGFAQLITGGGDIVAQSAVGGVEAESAGGRIELGEAAGAVHMHTGGGGVRIARLAGPTQIDSRDGGMVLAGVHAPLRASALAGGITAWLAPDFGDAGRVHASLRDAMPAITDASAHSRDVGTASGSRATSELISELSSGQGDIIVYLPPKLAVTIDALIQPGSGGRITADPALPLRVSFEKADAAATLHGRCTVNGGGEVLHLKTAGNIQLRVLDAADERRLAQLQAEGVTQQSEAMANRAASAAGTATRGERRSEAAYAGGDQATATTPVNAQVNRQVNEHANAGANSRANDSSSTDSSSSGSWWHGSWWQDLWWGGVRVDPDEQQKRLSHAVAPEYPEAAREAGIEGEVSLRVIIGPDGAVNEVKFLSGEPALARAAMEGVAQWHYAPALLDGWPVSVVTTVTVAFRLH